MSPAARPLHPVSPAGQSSTQSLSLRLTEAHSVEKRPANRAVHSQIMRRFISADRGPGQRSHDPVDHAMVVTELSEAALHSRDNIATVRRSPVVGVTVRIVIPIVVRRRVI
jgi:hypothetical protein